jgi:hypothetical protein
MDSRIAVAAMISINPRIRVFEASIQTSMAEGTAAHRIRSAVLSRLLHRGKGRLIQINPAGLRVRPASGSALVIQLPRLHQSLCWIASFSAG